MDILWLDQETYSEIELKTAGSYRYSEACEIMVVTYARNDGPVYCWDLTDPNTPDRPSDLADALRDPTVKICAQNSMFDRLVSRGRLYGFNIPIERWLDTMVLAYMHSLPGSLDLLGDIARLDDDAKKIKRGKDLIQLFCKPRPKNHTLRRATRYTHPEEWAEFLRYAVSDITSMRAIWKWLPKWNLALELPNWHLDQHINDRGVAIDLELCRAALREATSARADLREDIQEATLGVVQSATQRDTLIRYILEAYGVSLPDLKQDTIERRLLDPELPEVVKELLRIRAQASLASLAKFKAAIRSTGTDGRLRGSLQFGGAQRTLRWAGRIVQPGNMPRTEKRYAKRIPACVEAVKSGALDIVFDEPMTVLRAVTRGIFVAAPGRKLVVADYANVEGRGLALLAGENWKLKAFQDYDAGIGHDMYKLAYARSFNVDPATVDDGNQRQIGKVEELALGYKGGVAAFIAMALVYRMDLEEMAVLVLPTLPPDVLERARKTREWAREKRRTLGLSIEVYVACEALKSMWRAAHPATVKFWRDLEDAVRLAITDKGRTVKVGQHLSIDRIKNWLRIRLPSGRYMCYAGARVEDDNSITYRGVHQYTKQWTRIRTHGGKLAENVTQAYCRDIQAVGLQRAEAAGYPPVLHVHDEIITETPDLPCYSAAELSRIMTRPIQWARGVPLSAKGYEADRYRKE